MRRLTQGGASLCPGLSHFAPLGRGNEKTPTARGLSPVSSYWENSMFFRDGVGVDLGAASF
jgi:hypothetical protein